MLFLSTILDMSSEPIPSAGNAPAHAPLREIQGAAPDAEGERAPGVQSREEGEEQRQWRTGVARWRLWWDDGVWVLVRTAAGVALLGS